MAKTRKSVMLKSLKIGKLELKNRFVVSPMVTVFCDQDGMATEQFITYHETKAKGGWGLIIVEDYAVDPRGRGFWTPGLWKDEQIKSHKQLVDRVHKAGAKIFAQIYHSGRQTASALIGTTPWSASPIPCPVGCEVPHEMTIEEIEQTVSQFGDTALRAKKAGFDGVEVHGAHGYLISQFMSKYSNRRVDRYGGALENRLRFPIEILKDIRKKVGKDFIVDFRISADEYVDGGRTIEESKAAMKRLAAEGVDLFHVSAGVYGSAWAIIPPYNIPNGWIVNLAEEAKKVVDVPVITVGRINDPLIAETIVESGKADLVAMGRASLADPALPNKFAAGDYKDIRQCIGCQQGCLQLLFSNKSIRCLVNPELGFEYLHDLKKADASRRVTVVGGGPGGLEAARAAALAGHKVTLYDNTNRLGGQFVYAAMPPAKGDMTAYVVWAKRQLKKLGVEVKLNTEYTAAMCDEQKPDVVILATGSMPARPPIPGINNANVVVAEDALVGKYPVGQNVVVAGGGMIGSETASYLGSLGKKVTVVEMLPAIAQEEETTRRYFLMKMLGEQGATLLTETRIMEIKDHAVVVEDANGQREIPADTVILALGLTTNQALYDELKDKTKVVLVGDAVKVRDALEATREGFLAGANA